LRPLRQGLLGNIDEVIRLAALTYEDMGIDASDLARRLMAAEQLRCRLSDDVTVVVVNDPAYLGHYRCRILRNETTQASQSLSPGRLNPVGIHRSYLAVPWAHPDHHRRVDQLVQQATGPFC